MLHDHINKPVRRSKKLREHEFEQRLDVERILFGLEVDTQRAQSIFQLFLILANDMGVKLEERLENEVDEGALTFWPL